MARNQSEQYLRGPSFIAGIPGWTMEQKAHDQYYYVKDEFGVLIDVRSSLKMALTSARRFHEARVKEREIAQPTRGQYRPWRWSDVDDNDLDTMSDDMEVLITAKQLRKLLEEATNPHRAIQPGQAGTMTAASRRIWSAGTFRGWHENHGTKQK